MDELPFGLEELNEELSDVTEPGEELFEDDFDQIKTEGLPDHPHFPAGTFGFAVFADAVKVASLGWLGILAAIIGLITIRMYLRGKYGFLKRYVWKRALLKAGISSIPFLGAFLASWSWFVFRAHSKNWKRIDQILTSVEKLILRRAKRAA
ncbi:MAG: hypothetical protein G01um101430_86 [Parcubacteria group bacterium Gr01-1014_30]|nr:MAG: hypothetical protein G01um101430_86 [Parcubacteria group bacterium Gr01-1014_30]